MWLQSGEEGSRLEDPRYDIHEPADLFSNAPGHGTGPDNMGFKVGERVTVARAPSIGDEHKAMTTRLHFLRERFGRKQVTAGPTGGKDDSARAHDAPPWENAGPPEVGLTRGGTGRPVLIATPGRCRVSARTNPMPIAKASKLEPP